MTTDNLPPRQSFERNETTYFEGRILFKPETNKDRIQIQLTNE